MGTVTEEKGAFALPRLVGDNMLLQANVVNRVWGQSSENGEIAAQILKKDGSAEAVYYGTVQNGVFEIWLGKHGYGSGYGLRLVTKSGKSVTLKNVAFGELWIGGGQSNMGWTMEQCYRGTTSRLLYQKEIDSSANDDIRLFRVFYHNSEEPTDDVANADGWNTAQPSTVAPFSAAVFLRKRAERAVQRARRRHSVVYGRHAHSYLDARRRHGRGGRFEHECRICRFSFV